MKRASPANNNNGIGIALLIHAMQAALYHWRDTCGLTRPEAYSELLTMLGDTTLRCVLGDAAQPT